jgi:hypothetical protein
MSSATGDLPDKVEKDLRNRFPHAALIASGDLTAYLAERIRKLA